MSPGVLTEELPLETLVDDIEYWERLYNQQPASLTIVRTSNEDFKDRQIYLTLDDHKVGTLMFGETFTTELDPGPHRLKFNNTFVWKTIDFDVKLGEQVRFEVINRPGKLTYPMLLIVGVGPLYLTVRRMA
ncbi:MAG TPA: hypothetical protein VL262_10880 [Vicinamibacterales bacterium]|jgi:hypothetical protein|nr:hypothetical protein [Vicinamibacterales bacterium]